MRLFSANKSPKTLHGYNPFVKPGDIIVLKNKEGRFKVIECDEEKIAVVPVSDKEGLKAVSVAWDHFAGWRSK